MEALLSCLEEVQLLLEVDRLVGWVVEEFLRRNLLRLLDQHVLLPHQETDLREEGKLLWGALLQNLLLLLKSLSLANGPLLSPFEFVKVVHFSLDCALRSLAWTFIGQSDLGDFSGILAGCLHQKWINLGALHLFVIESELLLLSAERS